MDDIYFDIKPQKYTSRTAITVHIKEKILTPKLRAKLEEKLTQILMETEEHK